MTQRDWQTTTAYEYSDRSGSNRTKRVCLWVQRWAKAMDKLQAAHHFQARNLNQRVPMHYAGFTASACAQSAALAPKSAIEPHWRGMLGSMSGSALHRDYASRLQQQQRMSCLQNNAGPVSARRRCRAMRFAGDRTLSVQQAQVLQDADVISGAGARHLVVHQ